LINTSSEMTEALQPVRQALLNVRACRALLACEGWPWLVQFFRARMDALTLEVMEGKLTADERDQRIREYRLIKEVLVTPERQLEANSGVIDEKAGDKDDDSAPPDD